MTPRLKELYYKEIQPALKNQFGFKNLYMGPKIEKIVFVVCGLSFGQLWSISGPCCDRPDLGQQWLQLFFASKFSKPACGRCLFCFELCHKMSLGQAEGVIRAILRTLRRFSRDFGAFSFDPGRDGHWAPPGEQRSYRQVYRSQSRGHRGSQNLIQRSGCAGYGVHCM